MSRSRKSSNGTGAKIAGFLIVAGLIVAFFQIPYAPGVKGIQEVVTSKAQTVEQWVAGVAPGFEKIISDIIRGGGEPTPLGESVSPETLPPAGETLNKLNGVQIVEAANSESYNRDTWNHWVDVRSCWTVREQVLATEAKSLQMVDASGAATTDANKACEIKSGEWIDPYSGKTFTNPGDLDIDHMVPLSYAHQHGAHSWDNGKKQSYANDLTSASTLVAASASENRSKGDKGPSAWKPSNQAAWCGYATDWVTVSTHWGLGVSSADASALNEMLATCPQ